MITVYTKIPGNFIRNADAYYFNNVSYDELLWIELLNPTEGERKAVEDYIHVSLQTPQQITEIESTSKYSETEKAVIANTFFFVPVRDTFVEEPVSFIIVENVLVSVVKTEFRTLAEAAKRLERFPTNYPSGYHLLISILEIRIDYDADTIEALGRQIGELSKEVNNDNHINRNIIKSISHLQDNTTVIRENMFDRQRVISGILRSDRFPNDIYPKLSLMIKDINSLISHADFSSERIDNIHETALGLINLEQTQVTKIFTVAALFFMPPTMIASIYGMNFDFMPELHWKYGYLFALGMMVLLMVLTYIFFKIKKWL